MYDRASDELIINLVRPTPATLGLIRASRIGAPVRVHEVPRTEDELRAIQSDVEAHLEARRIEFTMVGIDVARNRVRVELPSTRAFGELGRMFGDVVDLAVAEQVENNDCTGRADCTPPLRGGLDIWRYSGSSRVNCSAGFVYDNASYLGSLKGSVITTAGHCTIPGDAWKTGSPEEPVGSVYQEVDVTGSSADVAFIDITDNLDSNDVYVEWSRTTGSAVIQNITSRGCANEISGSNCELVGEKVCYSGRNTGYRCGTLLHINVSLQSTSGAVFHNQRTVQPNTSAGGDSGAPAFNGSKAKGHLWGGNTSYWTYSHIYYVSDYCSSDSTCRVQVVD